MRRRIGSMFRWPIVLALSVGFAWGARAADIFEPWEKGFSDLEVYASSAEGAQDQALLLAGFGFGNRGSLGISISTEERGRSRFGAFLAGTWAVGRRTDLSLWGESGLAGGSWDVEVAHADWTAGLHAVHWREGVTPYGSITVVGEEGQPLRLHPLVGLMIPQGRVELHVELSSDQPVVGSWPVHLAVGPNVHVTSWVEVLPEISVVCDGGGTTHWAATIGLIVDPRHWKGGPE